MLSEYDEDAFFDNDEEDENEEDAFEADPSVVAALDQEGAEFEAQRAQFKDMYGFDHDCHCAQDYTDGALAQVTECYLELTDDALETCARLNWENQTLQGMVQTMVGMNDNLMTLIKESGIDIDPDQFLQDAIAESMVSEDGAEAEGLLALDGGGGTELEADELSTAVDGDENPASG
jgi:hypothetical protein